MNQALAGALALGLAAFGLTACDQAPQSSTAQTATQSPCPCAQPVQPQATVPQAASVIGVSHHIRRHRFAYGESVWHESEIWRESERSSSSYEHESVSGSSDERVEEGEHADEARYAVWVDGYGRRHFMLARDERGDSDRTAALAPVDEKKRHDPWHGYDATCDH